MKLKIVNGRWQIWTPTSVADWDGGTGDPVIPSGWEYRRLQSMQENLRWGDVMFDVGTEHAWLAAVIAREFIGPANIVLMEPSPEFWPNIFLTWRHNGFPDPLACWAGFVGAETSDGWRPTDASMPGPLWPPTSYGHETGAMAYRSLEHNHAGIPTITIDDMALMVGASPVALNIDVEGAEFLVLQGAENWLGTYHPNAHVWVSIHPDLMENFGHTPEMIMDYMDSFSERSGQARWAHEFLDTDHEQHHHFYSVPF